MKKLISLLILGSFVVLNSACSKVEKLEKNMDNMNEKTNEMSKTMGEMSEKMNETNGKMAKMVSAIHDQQIVIPYKEFLDEENGKVISPVPFRLMAYAEKFAEAATEQEFVKMMYLHIKEINEAYPSKSVDDNGAELPYSKKEVARINNEKLARYMALSTTAAFASDSLINEMIEKEIYKEGRFKQTALEVLMLRFQGLRDVFLNNSLLSYPLSSVGTVTESVLYSSKMDAIAKLPFASQIAIKTKGFLAPQEQTEEKLNPSEMASMWKSIQLKAELDCKVVKGASADPAKDQADYQENMSNYSSAMNQIKSYLDSWKK